MTYAVRKARDLQETRSSKRHLAREEAPAKDILLLNCQRDWYRPECKQLERSVTNKSHIAGEAGYWQEVDY